MSEANLDWANLSEANLTGVDLSNARLREADLREADLRNADLRGADLRGAHFDGVKVSTKEELETFQALGAITDEVVATQVSQFVDTLFPSSQSSDVQATSTLPAQGNVPKPDAGESNATSSQQGSGS